MLGRYELIMTDETPSVILDKSEGIFEFTGKSLPEDPNELFSSIIEWFKNYSTDPNNVTHLSFKLDYFNSSSSRKIIEIFLILETLIEKGNSVLIKWYYRKNDNMIEDKGREFNAVVDVPFEFLEY